MAGMFDDLLSYLMGGTQMGDFLGVGSPTASTQTPIIPPATVGAGPMLGGTPPAPAGGGGLLGGQQPAGGPPQMHQGLLGDSPLGNMLAGAFAGAGSVQPGQTGLAALGAGAQGAMTAKQQRQQDQMKSWYMQNQVATTAQEAADKAAKQKQLDDYVASLPPDQQAAARLAPEAYIGAGLKGAEPPKSRMVPQGNMEIPQDWDPTTKTWVTTGPPAPRWAPPSPGASVNVQMPAMESSASKAAGDVIGKDVGTVMTQGREAAGNIATLDQLQGLTDQINTGKYAGTVADLKKTALAAGIDLGALGITDNTAAVDAAKALSSQMALKLRTSLQMSGAMSDPDREFLTNMAPNISDTPAGIKLKIDFNRRVERRNQDLARITRDYIKSHNGNIDAGVYDEYQKFADAHPIVTDADRQAAAAAAAGGGQGGAPAGGQGAAATSGQTPVGGVKVVTVKGQQITLNKIKDGPDDDWTTWTENKPTGGTP